MTSVFRPSHSTVDVAAFLGTHFDAVSEVPRIGGGEWSQAFSFISGGRDLVVRFVEHVEDYRKDELAYRYAGPDLPIPKVIEIGDAFSAHYAVSERRYVGPLVQLDGEGLEAVLPSIMRFLGALRYADVSVSSGYGMWTPDRDAPFATWRDCLLAVGDDTVYPRV